MLPGYSPGTLQGRQVNDQLCAQHLAVTSSLTRLTFTAPDGTEYEMVDQSSGGQPLTSYCSSSNGASRGTVFVTADGTAMTFISDSIIYDSKSSTGSVPIYLSGLLLSRNGTRYRIDNGAVSWIRDRNGNQMTFTTVNGVYTITDSLNRQVTVASVNDPTYGTCDKITYNGFGGVPRSIYVAHRPLASVLRNTQPYDVTNAQTDQQLFPQLNYADSTTNNPSVVSAVWLPDGQGYHFFYNPYGQPARSAEDYLNSAVARARNKETVEALKDLDKAIEIDPHNATAFLLQQLGLIISLPSSESPTMYPERRLPRIRRLSYFGRGSGLRVMPKVFTARCARKNVEKFVDSAQKLTYIPPVWRNAMFCRTDLHPRADDSNTFAASRYFKL